MDNCNRALVILCDLTTEGDEKFKKLYQFLDASGVKLADMLLASHYGRYEKLVGSQVTLQSFLDILQSLKADTSIQAIDVIPILHGSPRSLWFNTEPVTAADLKQQILRIGLRDRLRLLYSLACYGASHAQDFVDAGFKAAIGAKGVNASSSHEYPAVLKMWAGGSSIHKAISVGDNLVSRTMDDLAAKALRFDDVNSEKVIYGDSSIAIDSSFWEFQKSPDIQSWLSILLLEGSTG